MRRSHQPMGRWICRQVLECARPLALWLPPKRRRTAAVQNAVAPKPTPFGLRSQGAVVAPWKLLLSVGALLFGAGPVQAHLMNSGLGPFYDGLAHPFLVPEDLLPVMAVTLLAGLRGAQCGRWVVFALPLAWLAGMTAAAVIHLAPGPVWLTCALTIALGALVAADRPWPVAVVVGLATVAGATHGFGNGRELATDKGGGLAMAGIVCALFVVSALIAGQVVTVRRHWVRLVVRVAGSWIAAIGLLMLGWSLRAGQ